MITIVKHEWHSHDRQYAINLTADLLSEIYPDLGPGEISHMLTNLEDGILDIEDVINDASDNDVELEWEFQYDDCWTERKGGYDITYELGDDSSWVDSTPPEPTHKCTKCKWTGQSYEAEWHWPEDDNEDAKQVCPYCESELTLTPFGEKEEAEKKNRMNEINEMFDDEEDSE